jgi:protein TonB
VNAHLLTSPALPPTHSGGADRLAVTLFIAAAVHALVILGVSFDALDRPPSERDTHSLDVTLVKSRQEPAPEEADYLAESNQDGSGNTDERVRPQEEAIAQAPPPASAESKPSPTQVMTGDESPEQRQQSDPTTATEDRQLTSAAALINRSMEIIRLNERINQSMQAYSKAPKSKFISARTKEFKYASYMRDWVAKVERVGELNYPDAARRQHLSGKLIVQVAIQPDGSVKEIAIRQPSGHKILDDAAVRIVKLAAPFAPFPDNVREETDLLYITRTWVFTSGNRLQSH